MRQWGNGMGAMKRMALVIVLTGAVARLTAQAPVVPGAEWARVGDPKSAGYCQAPLDAVTSHLQTLGTTAVTVVVGGKVLFDYGPQDEVTYLASVRKSILAMMFGQYIANGTIRLDATMADLGIDDVQGLLPKEKTATVRQLLASRSGVYHEAANAACTGCGSTSGDPPGPRGSVEPGSYFLYNNWDFNALGTIFEKGRAKTSTSRSRRISRSRCSSRTIASMPSARPVVPRHRSTRRITSIFPLVTWRDLDS